MSPFPRFWLNLTHLIDRPVVPSPHKRAKLCVRSFINMLTTDCCTGGTRPKLVDLHAHDVLRYIGDMLMGDHAIAAECEFLEVLLSIM
jgi:Conserved oligomeric complex COG6